MSTDNKSRFFQFPTKWIHGSNVLYELPKYIQRVGADNPMVIADGGVKAVGHLKSLTDILDSSKMKYNIFDEVTPEPYSTVVDNLIDDIRKYESDIFIAIGGGSTIDVAKGLCLLSDSGGSIGDYAGIENVPRPLKIPLIAIPTTSGTGSEVSPGAVFTDPDKESKFAVVSWNIAPSIAMTDPQLTLSVPKNLTAITGIDAFSHAAESYVSRLAMPVTEQFAIKAIELVGESLEIAVNSLDNLLAREKMQLASTMGMVSAGNAQNGLAHAIAMPLAAKFKLSHGLAVGVILPSVMAFNLETCPQKYRKIAEAFKLDIKGKTDIEAGQMAVTFIRNLCSKIGITNKLGDVGVQKNDIDSLVKGTMNSIQTSVNPRAVTPDEVAELIESAL